MYCFLGFSDWKPGRWITLRMTIILILPIARVNFFLLLINKLKGKCCHLWPNRRAGSAAHPADHQELGKLLICLQGFRSRESERKLLEMKITWNRGFFSKSSPRMQPQLQTSIAGPYRSSPSKSSGGLRFFRLNQEITPGYIYLWILH